ncbi:SusC/RagA family TonB-linked outer membrane protein [Daejeonella lutea]|uniref:TonB-linked outer membrane protein, SusC/RagA family n=1 Tax=Daejeonella lutea TaxID=572036 RepID=A0A1T5AK05_9SPHI|nr:TonB-dependent receptor [Daejeonella lutea]SKB35286.1 TonB-linked outer membrane protein, SusC/RagA family [Daejeonella lutea]
MMKFYSSGSPLSGRTEQQSYAKLLKKLLLFAFVLCVSNVAFAQKSIKGQVTENGAGLPGVSVSVKGTNRGTSTDANGNYSIMVPDKEAVLIFNMISFTRQEIKVGDQSTINISLRAENMDLNEVVVVGYGVQNRRDVTGSIARIDNSVLSTVPVGSFDAALQGRAAGVQVIQSTGMAGSGAQIRIRGTGSITAGGEPLYVMDGIPIPNVAGTYGANNVNPLASINTNDIESIEILKDASAAAIYGSRGANGVVLITTKRGQKGKPRINFASRLATSNLTAGPEMLNTQEFITLYKEAVANDFKFNPTGAPATRPLPGNVVESEALKTNTDWASLVVQTGLSTFNDFSISGGTEKFIAYLGLSNVNEKSFLVNDAFNRNSARLNLDYNPFKFLKVGGNISYSSTRRNVIPNAWDGGYGLAISNALPYFPAYNADGSLYTPPVSANPVAQIEQRTRKAWGGRTLSNLFTDVTFLKNLSLRLEGNLDYSDNSNYALTTSVVSPTPTASDGRSYLTNWNTKALLNYSLDLNKVHRFRFMAGTEQLKYTTGGKTRNVTFDPGKEDWLYNNPALPAEVNPDGTQNTNNRLTIAVPSEYTFISLFGRVNYTLKDKYIFTGTVRRDGSSRFGVNNKFGTFPAVSAAWIITEENFMKSAKALSYLKLKAGYGLTGNAEIGNYAQWGTTNVQNTNIYNGQQFWTINALANPDLKWETTTKYDAALEYGFLNNRLTGELAYYVNNAKDLFLGVRTPTSTGQGSVLANVGKLRNEGVEISLNSKNIVKKNFTWSTDLNLARNTNKVIDVGTASPDALGGVGDTRVIVGQPISTNFLVKTLYIDPADGMPVYEMLDPITKKPNGTTKVYNSQRDRQVVGQPYPDFIGGIENRFSWKNIDFGFMGSFQVGGSIYDDADKFQMNNIGAWNLKKRALQRWQKPGDVTDVARLTLGSSGLERVRNTTETLYDGSYFRLKTVNLGYTFPTTLVKRLKLSSARLSLSASNLFTITKFPGDPEIYRDLGNAQQRNLSANVSYLTTPQSRGFTLGLNVNL